MRPAVRRRVLAAVFLAAAVALPAAGVAQDTPSPSTPLTVAGRKLEPAGRMTPVGSFPTGGALTPDGRLYWSVHAELAIKKATLANVGRYPYGVALDPPRPRAYVTNERDGTVSAIEIPSGRPLGTIEVGGTRGAAYAHPQGIVADPVRDRVYVAVTDRDLVAVLDTNPLKLERYVDVSRTGAALGTAPVAPAVAPTGDTLYVAMAGADSVVAVALERRPAAGARAH